jgi:hypothetical protein
VCDNRSSNGAAAAGHVYVLAVTSLMQWRSLYDTRSSAACVASVNCVHDDSGIAYSAAGGFRIARAFHESTYSYDRLTASDKATKTVAKAASPSLLTMCFP